MSDMNTQLKPIDTGDQVPRKESAGQPPRDHRRLKLITYNIQIGIASTHYHHYVTSSWKHLLPHAESFHNLDRIAELVHGFDIVALQEADAGSFRSLFINQVEFLARRGNFPHWYFQTNRNLGKIAQHSNGLLSRLVPADVIEHKLPGIIPGRGLIEVHYGDADNPLVLLMVHLGLSKRARLRQLLYIARLVNRHQHVIVMGDFNCRTQSEEMSLLLECTGLGCPIDDLATFPSWRPNRNIDHILVTPSIEIDQVQVLQHAVSDHLPISVEIVLPEDLNLVHGEPGQQLLGS